MTKFIGVSGKIGSGKNYLADKLMELLAARGLKSEYVAFAAPLKDELTQVINVFNLHRNGKELSLPAVEEISKHFGFTSQQTTNLFNLLADDLESHPDLNGWSKTAGTRPAIQYLGTDIRRASYDNYWVDLVHANVPERADYVFATDARFPNEADSVRNRAGVLIRVEPSPEVINQRTAERDGLVLSAEARSHSSETALDDYENFDIIIGDSFDTEEVMKEIDDLLEIRS